MPISAPRGTQDILPAEAARWQALEAIFRQFCARYGYGEIRTPIFETTELFTRGVGEETDIVSKQMYTFETRGGDSITLRPEGTAPAVRALIQHNLMAASGVQKLCYTGPIFRYERPQKGRYRQFNQLGVEAFGSAGPEIDAEVLIFASDFLQAVGIAEAQLELNSVGCPACRPQYREALRTALAPVRGELCGDCERRFDTNPLRILDCKVPRCKELTVDAPVILDILCDECKTHLAGVEKGLQSAGIPYVINPHIVRGLDYYTRTAFEFVTGGLGAQNTVLAGGRYDGLVQELGGSSTPAIGFAAGEERLLLSAGDNFPLPAVPGPVFLAAMGEAAAARTFTLAVELRRAGVATAISYGGRSLKAQLKEANRLGASYTLILGDNELSREEITLRNMASSEQEVIPLGDVLAEIGKLLP